MMFGAIVDMGTMNKDPHHRKTNKIKLDKYYTPKSLAKRLINITYSTIGKDNITEIIEPSAGSGSFSHQIGGCIAYDIEPEGDNIVKQDFLKLKLPYKKGRLFIGNPPFGYRSLLVQKFYRHACTMGDYIAFIVPISQLNNENSMYQFELIKSMDLGVVSFGDRKVHTAFNIYKRPSDGKIRTQRPNYELDFIEIKEIRQARSQQLPESWEYDIGFCSWGDVGKIVDNPYTYNQEMYVKIKDSKYKEQVLKLLSDVDWKKEYPMASSPTLKQWQVHQFLYKNIVE